MQYERSVLIDTKKGQLRNVLFKNGEKDEEKVMNAKNHIKTNYSGEKSPK